MTHASEDRRWWLVSASTVSRAHLYEAPTARSAIATFRRYLADAEHTNGRSQRETQLWLRGNDFEATGPLTSAQAFDLEFRWQLSTAIDRWSPLQHDPDSPLTVDQARHYGLSDERIERIRQQVAAGYVQPNEELAR